MAKLHSPKLEKNGHYRVGIGYRLTKGLKTGTNHWLGKDKLTADLITKALEAAWEQETTTAANGDKIWCQQSIDNAYRRVGANPPGANPTVKSTPSPKLTLPPPPVQPFAPREYIPSILHNPAHPDITLHQALDRFTAYSTERHQRLDITRSTLVSEIERIKALKRTLPDLPLSSCDAQQLETMRGILTSRPTTIHNPSPVAPVTLQGWMMTLGMAFDWFSHPKSKIGWICHERWG